MAELKIKADSGGGTVSLKGPATTTSNAAVQLTLPVDHAAANQTLTTNGSGTLSWAAPVIADDSIVEAKLDVSNNPTNGQFLQAQSGEGGGLTWAAAGGGKIGQVLQSVKSDTSSTGSTTGYVLAGTDQAGSGSIFCCKMTPSAATSKILVTLDLTFSCNQIYHMDLLRDISGGTSDTNLFRGDAATNKVHHTMGGYHDADGGSTGNTSMTFKHNMHHVISYLDSPNTTSEVTYKTTWKTQSGYDILCGKNWGDSEDDANAVRTASSITLMEVLA